MAISALLFSILWSIMTERLFCADFFFSQYAHRQGLQHPYAGYRDAQKHLPGYPSTFAFCLDYKKLALPLSGVVMKPKCVCMVGWIHVVIQFLIEVINNSDNQKRYFIIVAKHCAVLTDLWGRFDSSISHTIWITVVIVHFTVSETLHIWKASYCNVNPKCNLRTSPVSDFWAKEPVQDTSMAKKLMTNISKGSKAFHVLMSSC